MNESYNCRVIWSSDDQMYVGLCDEFSLLSALADTREDALSGIRQVIEDAVAILLEDGEFIPRPTVQEQVACEDANSR